MLATIKNKHSLTFYAGSILPVPMAHISLTTATATAEYNAQLASYNTYCSAAQYSFIVKTAKHIASELAKNPMATATALRDKNTWSNWVKPQVVREELMSLQISGKCRLPLTEEELNAAKLAIHGKDLANKHDADINKLIESFIHRDEQLILNALKVFKETGKPGELLQLSKLSELKTVLEQIDLSKISSKQFNKLRENYCERTEFHHMESISSNPNKQSITDNVEPLKTSDHDRRHTDNETGKIEYTKPVKEAPLSRKGDRQEGNTRRILKNELHGLGIAVAIGFGIGVTIGFAVTLAQSGLTPETFQLAAIEGAKAGIESGTLAAAGYGIGRLISEVAPELSKVVNMGVTGILTTVAISAYLFTKLKLYGVSTRDALAQTGKFALTSLTVLAISMLTQKIFGGKAGIITSLSLGAILAIGSVVNATHQRKMSEKVQIKIIELYYPCSFVFP